MPSKPAGNSNQSVSSVSQVQLPQWVQNAAQDVYNYGQHVAQNLMTPYAGQRVADLPTGATADISALQNNVGATNPIYAHAQSGAAGVMGFNPQMITGFGNDTLTGGSGSDTLTGGQGRDVLTANTLARTDLRPYEDPFIQSVIDPSMRLLNQQRQLSLNQIGDQAVANNAFGGSRQGVSEGVTNAQSALLAGQLGAQLNSANFQQAQQAAIGDITRNFAAQAANQGAGLQGQQLNLLGAHELGSLAGAGQNSFLTGLSAALAGQGTLQQQQQAQLAAAQQLYGEQRQQPIDALQIQLAALGGVPYGQTQTNTQTGPGPTQNPYLTGLGALGTGVGILGGLSQLGAFGFLSDRDTKTDIKKLGKDPATDLTLYAYRYKGDPKTYPKIVGPMAQEVEQKYPGAVREIGGRKVINLGFGG